MTGKAIITNGTGWACSNEAMTDTIDTPVRGIDGKITSIKRKMVMSVKDSYAVRGGVGNDQEVEVGFMTDSKRVSFKGRVTDLVKGTIRISLHTVCGNEHTNALITKIKQIGGN